MIANTTTAETIDRYKGYHFYVPRRLTSHLEPYVAVDKNDERVAWINKRAAMKMWGKKNP